MALNRKLTPLLAGRIIQTVSQEKGLLWIIFNDRSVMRVKIAEPVPGESINGRCVRRVRQENAWMSIDFDDQTSMEITLAAPTSSVMLRSEDRSLEYAD